MILTEVWNAGWDASGSKGVLAAWESKPKPRTGQNQHPAKTREFWSQNKGSTPTTGVWQVTDFD